MIRRHLRAFSRTEDEYLRERTADIEDVRKRILRNLLGKQSATLAQLDQQVVVVAHDLSPEDHIHALAIFQKWVDSSISKTINFPKHATVDDMKKAYLLGYKLGCKDVTVYRDSSIENQVLSAPGKKEEKQEERREDKKSAPVGTKPTHCPKCSTKLIRGEGCLKCPSCGWGLCT